MRAGHFHRRLCLLLHDSITARRSQPSAGPSRGHQCPRIVTPSPVRTEKLGFDDLVPPADNGRMGKLKPRLLCFAFVAGLALPGCGSGQRVTTASNTVSGSVAASPARVAAEFSMYVAKIAANEDEPATPAQVAAYARALHMSCSPPEFGQYPCFSNGPGVRSRHVDVIKQPCIAIVGPSGQIATGRCADPGTKVAPVITPGYVDCSTVGKVVTITDPVGDQTSSAQHPLSAAARDHADLTEVRVAATPKGFCADFHTTTPFSQNSRLSVLVRGKGSDVGFTPAIDQDRVPVPGLYVSEPSAIAGHVGFRGEWASLVIPDSASAHPLPAGPFTLVASAEYEVYAPTGGYTISDVTHSATYP